MHRLGISLVFALTACKAGGEASTPASISEAYLAIGDKLAADELDNLDGLAASVASAAASKQTAAGVPDLLAGANQVAAQDISAARSAFKTMSSGMIDYLAAHPAEREGLQLVHCTMTFGGEGGYWVQRAGKVMNPYEGTKMLHCGDVTAWDDGPRS